MYIIYIYILFALSLRLRRVVKQNFGIYTLKIFSKYIVHVATETFVGESSNIVSFRYTRNATRSIIFNRSNKNKSLIV